MTTQNEPEWLKVCEKGNESLGNTRERGWDYGRIRVLLAHIRELREALDDFGECWNADCETCGHATIRCPQPRIKDILSRQEPPEIS